MNNTTLRTLNNKKGFTLVEIMIVVVIIGLLAAMAVPAFNKVRTSAREKAIVNNLRQIVSAGQQYLIDNGSAGSVTYDTLVTSGYLKSITPVTDEVYTGLTIQDSTSNSAQTLSITSSIMGKTVSYSY